MTCVSWNLQGLRRGGAVEALRWQYQKPYAAVAYLHIVVVILRDQRVVGRYLAIDAAGVIGGDGGIWDGLIERGGL